MCTSEEIFSSELNVECCIGLVHVRTYIHVRVCNVVFSVQWDIGRTALHKVSGIGETAIVTLLLEYGADICAVDAVRIYV